NIGVHGLAYNGPNENWAGWFDGDVNVNGNFLVNGQQVDGNIDTIYNPLTVFFNTDTEEPTAVRAYSDGPGNGGVSYNTAMRGESYNNSYANVGLSGWATGSQGVDNSGGSFFSQVNNGSDTIVNTGVYMQANSPARNYGLRAIAFDGTENYGGEFTANGPGMNVGMYSTAFNGTDNWAGWFDGDVQVNGDFVLNGNSLGGNIQNFDSLTTKDIQLLSPDGNLKAHLNYFEANNAGSLVLYGNSDTTRTAILGSSGLTGGNSGLLYLYDQFDAAKARLRVDTLAGGADDYGILTLWNGDFTQSVYLDGSTGSGYFSGDVEVGGQLLVNGAPANDSIVSKDVQLLNESGSLKAHLNIFSTDAGSLVLNGANDSTKVILGSVGSGYGGYLGLYDSLRNIGAQLRTTNKGRGNLYTYNENHVNVGWFGGIGNDGFMQLVSYDDTETFTGALLAGSFADGALPELYIEGSKQLNYGLGRFRITQLSDNPDEETAMLEINKSNGGGYARLSVNQNTGGSDATGSAGYLELWGTSTPNISLGSRDWENHNLPNFNLYGTKTDGGTWFNTASNYGVAATSDSTHEFGFLDLFDVQDGIQIHTVALMANLNETGAGGLEIRDASGTTRVSLDGSGGNISANRTDGGSAANFFVASDNGGISIQNAASQSKFFYEAGSNIFILRNDTADSFVADATAGSISILGDLTANAVNQTSDKRYKKDIATLTGALDKTRELRGTSYFWKDSNKGDGRQIGVIAQEVEEVYPEFVHTDANGYKSVNYAQMVAVLIEAVKELDDKVSTLEKENGELKAELASKDSDELESLKSEVELIKKMLSLKVENEAESVGQNK
ncbi:MAG TPA: hypothetical protein DHN29_00185, partial [Cytophagales bacterium]|nr:hypothetical protein [Cytophagales bacterium]